VGADVDATTPEVQDDLFDWGAWVIDNIGATGFRFDAVKVSIVELASISY
jgi:alpha-amylase